mgnify:FL=1
MLGLVFEWSEYWGSPYGMESEDRELIKGLTPLNDMSYTAVAEDCLFCKIASKRIPADVIFEDDKVVAFKDIEPQAPVHILVIPKVHIPTINGLSDASVAGHLVLTATSLASQLGISESGYRLVMNCNEDGGQTVFHIHLHILGGHQLTSMV